MKKIFFLNIALFGHFALAAQTRYYVNQNATGVNNGQSWQNAYTDLQSALQTAQAGDEIWVAQGTYFPTAGTDQSTFEPKSGVKLYGGFAGTETDLTQRDWETNQTILSGDIGISGDSLDNSYTILYLDNPDSLTVIDGLIFRYGYAGYPTNDQAPTSRFRSGGAMYIQSDWESYPMIRNCRFEHNSARNHGGAVYVNGTGSFDTAPTFQDCIFEYNTALTDGGAVARIGNSDLERPDFVDCKFTENKAGRYGGGLYFQDAFVDSWVDVSGCSFMKNEATNEGAGAFLRIGRPNEGSKARVEKCLFDGNRNSSQLDFFLLSGQNTKEVYIQKCVFLRDATYAIRTDLLGTDSSFLRIERCRFEDHLSAYELYTGSFIPALIYEQDTILGCPNAAITVAIISSINNCFLSRIHSIGGLWRNNIQVRTLTNNVVEKSNLPRGLVEISQTSPAINFKSCSFIGNTFNTFVWGAQNYSEPSLATFENSLFHNCDITYNYPVGGRDVIVNLEHCHLDKDSICETNKLNMTTICGPGNLFGLDPLFRDTANGDYSLLPCSPLINAGSNAAAAGILNDIAGNPRILEGRVDIGAYEAPAFVLAASPAVSPACVGTEGGSISLQPTNGCEPYTYAWMPNAGTGPELNGLPPGAYQLTLTDASGRQITDTILVPEALQPELNLATTHVQCGNPAGGSLTALVSSGTGPFSYAWLPLAVDTSMLKSLAAGTYFLTLTDANGCQDSASASILLLGALSLGVGGQAIPCYGQTGWLSATPANGAAPFSWLWSGWTGTDSLAQPLTPGNYAVTVSDAYGCTASFVYPTMTQPDSMYLGTGTTPQSQPNPPNGTALVTTISGGTSPFSFEWNTMEVTQAITGLEAGTYTVTVSDKNGCTATAEVVVKFMVSTQETDKQVLMLYPNPAADWVRLLLPAGNWQWDLSDAGGLLLRTGTCSGEDAVLGLSGLSAGAYVLRVWNGQETLTGRVLKH